jgi:hypothetical protein
VPLSLQQKNKGSIMQIENKTLTEQRGHLTTSYDRFCEKNELDPTVDPEEQLVDGDSKVKWLDQHILKCNKVRTALLNEAKAASARKSTPSVSVDDEMSTPVEFTVLGEDGLHVDDADITDDMLDEPDFFAHGNTYNEPMYIQ